MSYATTAARATLTGVSSTTGAFLAKFIQTIETMTTEKIQQHIYENQTLINNKIQEFSGNCDNIKDKWTSDKIINYLTCRIIKNKETNQTILSKKNLQELAAIINLYSDNTYIALSKKDYDNDKKAASDAVLNSLGISSIINLGGNIGIDEIRKYFSELFKSKSISQQSSPEIAETQTAATLLPAATSYAVAKYAAPKFFKHFNSTVPEKYQANFKLLMNAIVEKTQQIEEINTKESICFKSLKTEIIERIKQAFVNNRINLKSNKDFIKYNLGGKDIIIKPTYFDFKNNSLTQTGNILIKNPMDSVIYNKCRPKYDEQRNLIKSEIEEIKDLLKKYQTVFDLKTEGQTLDTVVEEMVPLINGLALQPVTMDKIREIETQLDEMEREVNSKKSATDRAASAFASVTSRVASTAREGASNISGFFTGMVPKSNTGGRKSRKLRKRKTQKRRKGRKTHRHN